MAKAIGFSGSRFSMSMVCAPIPAQGGAALRICADPDTCPIQIEPGQGFENKLPSCCEGAG